MSGDVLFIIIGAIGAWVVVLELSDLAKLAIQHPCIAAIFILSCVAAYFRINPRNDRGGL